MLARLFAVEFPWVPSAKSLEGMRGESILSIILKLRVYRVSSPWIIWPNHTEYRLGDKNPYSVYIYRLSMYNTELPFARATKIIWIIQRCPYKSTQFWWVRIYHVNRSDVLQQVRAICEVHPQKRTDIIWKATAYSAMHIPLSDGQ